MTQIGLPIEKVRLFVETACGLSELPDVTGSRIKSLTGIAPSTLMTWYNKINDLPGDKHAPTHRNLQAIFEHCQCVRNGDFSEIQEKLGVDPTELQRLLRNPKVSRLFDAILWEVEEVLYPIADEDMRGLTTWIGQTIDARKNQVFPQVPAGMTRDSLQWDFINLYLSKPQTEIEGFPEPISAIQALEYEHRRLFVLGMPGSGKSCLLTMAASQIHDGKWGLPAPGRGAFKKHVPIAIELPLFEKWLKGYKNESRHLSPLAEYAAGLLDRCGLAPSVFRRAVGRGSLLFLLDTFDQVSDSSEIAGMILELDEDARSAGDSPGDWIVVCTRPGVEHRFSDPNDRFARVELLPLNARQKWDLLKLRLGDKQLAWKAWDVLRQLPDDLTSTPLITSVVGWLVDKGWLEPGDTMANVFQLLVNHLVGEGSSSSSRRPDATCADPFDALSAAAIEHRHTKCLSRRTVKLACGGNYGLGEDQAPEVERVLFDTPVFVGPPEERHPFHQMLIEYGFARQLSRVGPEGVERLIVDWSNNVSTFAPDFFVELADNESVNELLTGAREAFAAKDQFLAFARVALRTQKVDAKMRQHILNELRREWTKHEGEAFRSPNSYRSQVARCLGMDRETVESYCQTIERSDDETERNAALDMVVAMQSPWAVPFLRDRLDKNDDDNRVRFYATKFLGTLGDATDVTRFYKRWDKEPDWDVQMAMLDAASQLPSDDLGCLLQKATHSKCRDVVSWEAGYVKAYHDEKHYVAIAATLCQRPQAKEGDCREAECFADSVMQALEKDDGETAYDAGASIRKCVDSMSDLACKLQATFADRLCGLLREQSTTTRSRLTWITARCLRSLLNRISQESARRYLSSIRRSLLALSPEYHGYARGEIARTLGDLVAGDAVRDLCQTYSPLNDQFERLWIMHAIWEILRSVRPEDIELVYETVCTAVEYDDYKRAETYARRTKSSIESTRS